MLRQETPTSESPIFAHTPQTRKEAYTGPNVANGRKSVYPICFNTYEASWFKMILGEQLNIREILPPVRELHISGQKIPGWSRREEVSFEWASPRLHGHLTLRKPRADSLKHGVQGRLPCPCIKTVLLKLFPFYR